MSAEATKQIDANTLWGGGRSPFSISYGKMMMWFFLISDALTFGGLLSAVGFFKYKYQHIWPSSEEVFHAFPGFEGTAFTFTGCSIFFDGPIPTLFEA